MIRKKIAAKGIFSGREDRPPAGRSPRPAPFERSERREIVSLHRVRICFVGGHLKYREYVCVPAVAHPQHPVKASSPGELQYECCAEPCDRLREIRRIAHFLRQSEKGQKDLYR